VNALQPVVIVAGGILFVVAWIWFINRRQNPVARHRQNPLWLGFTMTAASLLFLISGFIGFNLSRRDRFLNGTAWSESIIWWEVAMGAALLPIAAYLLYRGGQEINARLREGR
jgi:hypothetical protein